jgi:type II secretory pathway component GspD/PulD (secretin)
MDFVQNFTTTKGTNGLIQSVSSAISTVGGSGTNSGFGNNLPGGVSYFANIGPNWDVAMTAVQSDSHAAVIQRPRIQTSQAKPAQFFVGDTVPYVTGDSYGSVYGSGVSYSQLSVGVELDVTPFINPDGLVVMDIQQEIDDLNGYTTIQNVGQVPNTIKRTLNSEIAVRDRDTVMLGGFIKSDKSTSRSGVPFLMDIPILGNLFLQRADSKQREELIVLMRPTVLNTPELAAEHTGEEERRLPGVGRAMFENNDEENTRIQAEQKYEMQQYKTNHKLHGFYTPQPDENVRTNTMPLDLTVPPTGNNVPTNTESVTPVSHAVHPQAGVAPAQTAPAPENSAATTDAAAMQQKAQAALAQKMMELNSTNSSH